MNLQQLAIYVLFSQLPAASDTHSGQEKTTTAVTKCMGKQFPRLGIQSNGQTPEVHTKIDSLT